MLEPSLDALPVAVARIDREKRIVWANDRLAVALERPREEILGHTCRELGLGGGRHDDWERELEKCFRAGEPGRFIQLIETGGEWHLIDYRFVPEAGEGPEPSHVLAVAYINQEAERLRAALATQHGLVRTFLEQAPVLAWLRDEEGRYRLVNDQYKSHFGVRDEDILGRTVQERWPGQTGERFAEEDRIVAEAGEVRSFLEVAPHPDGGVHTFETVKFPVQDASGAQHIGGIALDVTHRMEMARTMGHFERVRDLAANTAGVVHDLSNDVFVITTLLKELEARQGEDPLLAAIRVATDRAVTRLRELREQSMVDPADQGVVRLTDVVEKTVEELGGVLHPDLEVIVEVASVDSRVRGNASALQRVIENLLTNASDAAGEGPAGQVRLTLSREVSRHGTPMVVLSVADNGPGIAPVVRKTLFEPFTSTKGERRGLGLAGARAVARRHGGELRVGRTDAGRGATFELRVPASDAPEP